MRGSNQPSPMTSSRSGTDTGTRAAKFVGTIDHAARTVTGQWRWPGGGYDATTVRID